MIKSILLAGVAVAGLGGIAAADPPYTPPQQPVYGQYQNGNYVTGGYAGYDAPSSDGYYSNGVYGDGDADDYDRTTDEGYTQPAPVYTQPAPVYTQPAPVYDNEPAAGTYQNGYVWVAGAYTYPDGVAIWMPGHWQLAQANIQPVYRRPLHVVVQPRVWGRGRTARSYRWRSRW